MKKNSRKSNEATSATKTRKATPVAPVVSLASAKTKAIKVTKGAPFNGDWSTIPSSRQLLALVIRSLESGLPIVIPTTRDAARAALGYEKEENVAKSA